MQTAASSVSTHVEIPLPLLLSVLIVLICAFLLREQQLYVELAPLDLPVTSPLKVESTEAASTSAAEISSNDRSATSVSSYESSDPKPSRGNLSYRMEEEFSKKTSSEFTRRGQLWSKHASWKLPEAPRFSLTKSGMKVGHRSQGLEHVFSILAKFDVDPSRGFLPPQDPLQRLPCARYHIWEDLADDLPKLLGARLGQARGPLRQLPVLETDKLVTNAELRRAHLLLCIFAHAYIWGGPEPLDEIPTGIAKPLWEVAKRLEMPPVLGHPSIVLYNWRRLDNEADISMENLSTLNNFFDGRDESWFYLITVELEQRGAASVVPMMLLIDAIQRYKEEDSHRLSERARAESTLSLTSDEETSSSSPDPIGLSSDSDYSLDDETLADSDLDGERNDNTRDEEALIGELTEQRVAVYAALQLRKVADAILGMCHSMAAMREGCHPFIFYHRVRPFLSAWKNNPTLPNGVIYQGVSLERQQFYGGSAAQSSLLPFLDIGLGVSHESSKSHEFLLAMRDYMPRQHREFLQYLETVACIRQFIIDGLKSRDIKSETRSKKETTRTCTEAHRSHLGSWDNGACIKGQFSRGPVQHPSHAEIRLNKDRDVWLELRDAYDSCIDNLQAFRSCHMSIVAEYIIAQQKKGVDKDKLEGSAGGKGTGGTDLMKFLKPIRDNCGDSLLAPTPKYESTAAEEPPKNDRGCSEDIDLFRGAAHSAGKVIHKTSPVTDRGWDVATTGPIVFSLSRQ